MQIEIDKSWSEFISALSKKSGEIELKVPLLELLDEQKTIDRLKKECFKEEVGQALKLYLSRIDLLSLSSKIETHEKIFKAAFGRDKFNHLKLLVKLKVLAQDKKPKRGLLAV